MITLRTKTLKTKKQLIFISPKENNNKYNSPKQILNASIMKLSTPFQST
jgi:hypothetical protein